jgi:hypothetical protein
MYGNHGNIVHISLGAMEVLELAISVTDWNCEGFIGLGLTGCQVHCIKSPLTEPVSIFSFVFHVLSVAAVDACRH